MVELPHQLDFVDEGLLPLVLAVGCFLRKRLYGEFAFVLQANCQINGCKIAFSDFFNRLKQFVEPSLIELLGQYISPFFERADVVRVHEKGLLSSLEFEAERYARAFFDLLLVAAPQQLEDEIKIEGDLLGGVLSVGALRFHSMYCVVDDRPVIELKQPRTRWLAFDLQENT